MFLVSTVLSCTARIQDFTLLDLLQVAHTVRLVVSVRGFEMEIKQNQKSFQQEMETTECDKACIHLDHLNSAVHVCLPDKALNLYQ